MAARVERRPSLLSREDVDRLYHHFLRLDADGNGMISREELLALPVVQHNPLAARLLDLFDTDRSGALDFSEFVAGLALFSARAEPAKKLRFAFDIYDIDGDGFISNGELFITLKLMSGDHLKDEQLQQIVDKTIRDTDLDGDGKISFEEFKLRVQKRNHEFLDKWIIADL